MWFDSRTIFAASKVFFSLLFLTGAALGEAAEVPKKETNPQSKDFKYQVIQTPDGLNFRVPEDMPVEKRGGIEAPIPFDEYMYGKFRQMDDRLGSIEKQLDRIEKILSPPPEQKPVKSSTAILKSE